VLQFSLLRECLSITVRSLYEQVECSVWLSALIAVLCQCVVQQVPVFIVSLKVRVTSNALTNNSLYKCMRANRTDFTSSTCNSMSQMKAAEGITEALKARDPMQWVQRMNSIRDRAEEILREELIYV